MADEQDDSQKTEEPTAKRQQDAVDKGQVASSRDLSSFLMLSVGLAFFLPIGGWFAGAISQPLIGLATRPHLFVTDPGALGELLRQILWDVMLVLAVPMSVLVVAALASGLLMHGLVFTTHPLTPKLERISPLSGFKRLFSMKSLVEFAKSMAKVTLIGAAAYFATYTELHELLRVGELSTIGQVTLLAGLGARALGASLVVIGLLAAFDVGFQLQQHHKQLRMTRHEVKEELKQSDGDPHVKQRLRQIRSEKARQRIAAEVPNATVVVTNPTHVSVALRYEPGEMAAPIVVAKGIDDIAMRIREIARAHDVPLVENRLLARSLNREVKVGAAIPEAYYQAVAGVISFVMQRKGQDQAEG
ncbi:MAG: flagellar biosynthesis protein FlhB [Geminicoccaceae bacterium]